MGLEIEIDKSSESPVYRQIIEQITRKLRAGELKPGDKLPTERELAEALGIARGTVNRAYEELTRSQILESIPGRGSFISAQQDVAETSRKERAVALISELIDTLRNLRFSYREIRTLIELGILEKERLFEELSIAVVDCNPEALAVFRKQLNFLTTMPLTLFLLDDLAASTEVEKKLATFDLVLTSARHYTEVLGMAPGIKEKLIQVALSPSQDTIIALATIKPGRKLGVICESRQFRDIILNKLRDLMIDDGVEVLRYAELDRLPLFLADKEVIIVPPSWKQPEGKVAQAALQDFTSRGGKLIIFDYQVERGSVIYVEERVRDLLAQ
ncbi:MAG: GntR family transcriptional regulator [Spirochaetota bacterium]|jgi:DNA-binding transcriptional regulator YhcF (GntR family)|uniref:GntR family transcriptional regulator n=1 Tax=Gracilinema caldarium TaxID=215591 RepID=UPI0026EC6D84|nr:GntR family transcriptional regulator [Gracilinema caldarium]